MVRVLLVVASFKKRMVGRMVARFSGKIVHEDISPTDPATARCRIPRTIAEKIESQLFGGRELLKAIVRFGPDIRFVDAPLYGAQIKFLSASARVRMPMVLHLCGHWRRGYWSWFSQAKNRGCLPGSQELPTLGNST